MPNLKLFYLLIQNITRTATLMESLRSVVTKIDITKGSGFRENHMMIQTGSIWILILIRFPKAGSETTLKMNHIAPILTRSIDIRNSLSQGSNNFNPSFSNCSFSVADDSRDADQPIFIIFS